MAPLSPLRPLVGPEASAYSSDNNVHQCTTTPPLLHLTSFSLAFARRQPHSEQVNWLEHPYTGSSWDVRLRTLNPAWQYDHGTSPDYGYAESVPYSHPSPLSPVPSSPSNYAVSPPRVHHAGDHFYINTPQQSPLLVSDLPYRRVDGYEAPAFPLVPLARNPDNSVTHPHHAHISPSKLYPPLPTYGSPLREQPVAHTTRPHPVAVPTTHERAAAPKRPATVPTLPPTPHRAVKRELSANDALAAAPPRFVPLCIEGLAAPPVLSEVPICATGAPPAMRRMMGAFRLDPFALHDGVHAARRLGVGAALRDVAEDGAPRDTREVCWNGKEAGPLKDSSALVEFQVALDNPDNLLPVQVKYPHLFPSMPTPPPSPEAPCRPHCRPASIPTAGLYTLDPELDTVDHAIACSVMLPNEVAPASTCVGLGYSDVFASS